MVEAAGHILSLSKDKFIFRKQLFLLKVGKIGRFGGVVGCRHGDTLKTYQLVAFTPSLFKKKSLNFCSFFPQMNIGESLLPVILTCRVSVGPVGGMSEGGCGL